MAAPSYYQIQLVALDMSANTSQLTINTGAGVLKLVRPANSAETSANGGFPTAQTALIFQEVVGQTERWRTALTATPYATINTALTA